MLKITVPATELYDDEKNEYSSSKEQTIQLEHSLISLSKWESKWKKPFLTQENKSFEESLDYIRCMTITQNVGEEVFRAITQKQIREINEYIGDPMTATVITNHNKRSGPKEIITSELIYYWMIALTIPPEYQKWHLNRLLTLIEVCNIKNQPPKKMSKRELMARNRELNSARRQALNTKG